MTNEEVEVSKSIGKQDFDEIVDYCRDRGFSFLHIMMVKLSTTANMSI